VFSTILATGAAAFTVPDKTTARVNDYTGTLDAASKSSIESRLAAFEQESSTQVLVAVIPSLDGDAIEDVAIRTFERWGLGQKGSNNGVLLLIAMSDRKARIEVGYGLEDRLTDALSRRILEERLFPAFRSGRYGDGILAACDGIIAATKGAYTGIARKRKKVPPFLPLIVPIAIILLFILANRGGGLSGRGRRRTFRTGPFYWGGGGFGGGGVGGGGWSGGGGGGGGFGGFSGGGGMSGGGGASGSW
jgi:uncharacterized protein